MSSKITFSNIKHCIIKASPDITQSERSAGKLQAGSITNRLEPGLTIDVFVLKNACHFICSDSVTFDEDDIREGTRRQFTELAELFRRKGRLPVHADFFREVKEGDTIIIILHGD